MPTIHFGSGPQRGDDGKLVFFIPMGDKRLPGISVALIRKCTYGMCPEGTNHVGKTIGVASEHLTGKEMAAELWQVPGEVVSYYGTPRDECRALGLRARTT